MVSLTSKYPKNGFAAHQSSLMVEFPVWRLYEYVRAASKTCLYTNAASVPIHEHFALRHTRDEALEIFGSEATCNGGSLRERAQTEAADAE